MVKVIRDQVYANYYCLNMKKYNLEDLVSLPFPFDMTTFNHLFDTKEGHNLIGLIHYCYGQIEYPFSAPGNSFQRNVMNDLNFHYFYRSPSNGTKAFDAHPDDRIVRIYRQSIRKLRVLAEAYKFRELSAEFKEALQQNEKVKIYSEKLTEEGLRVTIGNVYNA